MSCDQPDITEPLKIGLSPCEVYQTCMTGLEQFEVSYQSRIDRLGCFIDDQIKIENEPDHSYVRLAFMKYTNDAGDFHCDIEIEVKIGTVFVSALLSPNYMDPDIAMATVEDAFDKCCRLIGKTPKDTNLICEIPVSPDSPLVSFN